jgi:prepilin-type N-terminal cleavage/methylation domain-containing protein
MNRQYHQAGFTLVEILIAITILSFVMLSIITITDSSITTKDRVIAEDEQYMQVETALSRMDWDISQAYSPLYFSHEMKPQNLTQDEGEAYNRLIQEYQNNDRFAFPSYDALPVPIYKADNKNSLTFFTSSNRRKLQNIKQSHFAWVYYGIENDDAVNTSDGMAKGVLVRKFEAHDVFNNTAVDWSRIKSQVLLRNVENIKFEFWNPSTQKWVDSLDVVKHGKHLFRGVKLTLEWIDPTGNKAEIIRVFRPLMPNFEAEDMYKLERESNAQNSTTNNNNNNNNNTNPDEND